MGRLESKLLEIAKTLPADQRRRVVAALVHAEGPRDREWERAWTGELARRVAAEADTGASRPWHEIQAEFEHFAAERQRWPRRPAGHPHYVSLPHDGDSEIEAGALGDWYTSTCTYCGMPTGPRNRRPLALGKGYGRAWVLDARMRAPHVVGKVPMGRRTTLVRARLAERLVRVVPGIQKALRATTRYDVFELVVRERVEPVGRPGCPWDRAGFRCPRCKGLFETWHDDRALGVCLDGARPAFFSYDIADRQRLFVRSDLFPLVSRGQSDECIRAFDVPKKDATSLRSVARVLRGRATRSTT